MESKQFWDIVLVLLSILLIGSLFTNLYLQNKLFGSEEKYNDAELKNYLYASEYYEYTIHELEQDLFAKNSLLINFCRRGYEPACGMAFQ